MYMYLSLPPFPLYSPLLPLSLYCLQIGSLEEEIASKTTSHERAIEDLHNVEVVQLNLLYLKKIIHV